MDLGSPIDCIGPTEPTFVGAIVLALLAAIVAWRGLARLGAFVTDPWRRRLYLPPVWAIALFVLLLGPSLLLDVVYSLLHAHARVCTHFVYRAFYLPPLLLAVLPVARRLWQRAASRGTRGQVTVATRPRAWASAVLGLGMLCLTPIAFVTWLYYAHLLDGDTSGPWGRTSAFPLAALPIFMLMALVYASMVGGPLLIVIGAIRILARNAPFPAAMRMVRTGSMALSLWCALGLAVWPPDAPVRIVVAVMTLASLFIVITAWRRQAERNG